MGIDTQAIGEEKATEALSALYQAFKDIESLGFILEIRPRYFKLVDSGPRQLGRKLSPLLQPYRQQNLDEKQAQFLQTLAELTKMTEVDASGTSPLYVRLTGCRVSDVYEKLGWPWTDVADPAMLTLLHDLKEAGMLDTAYIGRELRCNPTIAGMAWVEG
jgi:DNA-binding PadR family transcriptional regulator